VTAAAAQRGYEAAYRERKRLGLRSTYHNALTPEERLLGKVACDIATRCWLWTGPRNEEGYGITQLNGHTHSAHRAVWLVLVGVIPQGLEPDHLCRVRLCVSPAHIELVTHRENCLRGRIGAHLGERSHCKNGHPYDSTNTRYDARGARLCRSCSKERTAAYRIRRSQQLVAA
jgi:hypothetical protein